MSDIICKYCGLTNDYKTVVYPATFAHWGAAVCNGCNIHIKWLANPDKEATAFKDDTPMPWGKHKGKAMANVPADYLMWLNDQPGKLHPGIKQYITDNLDVLRTQLNRAR